MGAVNAGFNHYVGRNFVTNVAYYATDVYQDQYLDKIDMKAVREHEGVDSDFCQFVLPEGICVASFGFSESELVEIRKYMLANAKHTIRLIKEGEM